MNPFLFVYGTLRNDSSHEMAEWLRLHAEFMGEGALPGIILNLGAYIALLYDSAASGQVPGHVFKLKNAELVLSVLDEYEGVGSSFESPQEYRRIEAPVIFNGEELLCQVYEYNLSSP